MKLFASESRFLLVCWAAGRKCVSYPFGRTPEPLGNKLGDPSLRSAFCTPFSVPSTPRSESRVLWRHRLCTCLSGWSEPTGAI